MDDLQQQVRRDAEPVEPFGAFYQTSMEELAQQVTTPCQGLGRIPADYFLTCRTLGMRLPWRARPLLRSPCDSVSLVPPVKSSLARWLPRPSFLFAKVSYESVPQLCGCG